MPSVIEELNGEVAVDAAHVRERVEEWRARVLDLYDNIVSWVPHLTSDRSGSVEMNEAFMREHRVEPVSLPILQILDADGEVAQLIPRGLWIIGANGRVDLFSRKGLHIVVDRSQYFAPAQWEIAPALERLARQTLSRETFLQAIE